MPLVGTVYIREPSCDMAAMVLPTIRSGPASGTLDSTSATLLISAPSLLLHTIFAATMVPPLPASVRDDSMFEQVTVRSYCNEIA